MCKCWSVMRRLLLVGKRDQWLVPDQTEVRQQTRHRVLEELQDFGGNRIPAVCLKACWILESKAGPAQVGCRAMGKCRDKCGSAVRGCAIEAI